MNGYVDFHLEQYGLSDIPGDDNTNDIVLKGVKRLLDQPEDNAAFDLGPEGVQKLNNMIDINKNVYYFAYPFKTTRKSLVSNNQVALPSTNPFLMPLANMIGEYDKNRITDFQIDETWLANDGLVNVVSAQNPFDEPAAEYDPSSVERGVWNVMPVSIGDHGTAIGMGADEKAVMDYYNGIIDMIENLE